MSADPAGMLAALWRLSREEAASLTERIGRLERAVMQAMAGQAPQADAVAGLLAEQRGALEDTRLRTARILDLLDGR